MSQNYCESLRDLREKVFNLQMSVAYLDKKMRCRNVVWKGIKDEDESYEVLVAKVLDVINNRLKLKWRKEDIEDVYRIGRKGTFDRPILMSIASLRMKFLLMSSKMKLRGTKIFINQDLPYNYRMKIRKQMEEKYFKRNLCKL
ncbi:PREDICTED: uncharacterized protein LOC108560450 [Nicrophorus vespilloides]|uniref:Uncharacterized protein LOC108560450 n=1 Tax=Nicrophorus vespilloides TaxID=110193 RepID=A0ABM1MFZ4_NICVS|nr:PREDICTED: uncharacterized protein LOC108560450 [Nicrophorus vespilloides]